MTPGLWDPESGFLFNEVYENVTGEGIRIYDIEMAVFETGQYTVDATAFYQIDNEWFIDDEGFMSFEVNIEAEQGQSILIYIGALVLIIVLAVVFLRDRIQTV